MAETGQQIQKLMVEMEGFTDGNDRLLCPKCLFFPFLSHRNKKQKKKHEVLKAAEGRHIKTKNVILLQTQE